MLSLVQEAAKLIGITRSEFVRQAITDKLENFSSIRLQESRRTIKPQDHSEKRDEKP
jgi:hypothetical protein